MTDKLKIWLSYQRDFRKRALNSKFSESQIEACLLYAKKLFDGGFPIIFDGQHFSHLVGYQVTTLFSASNAKDFFYREYRIPKKNGSERIITEPLPSLKEIQRWILDNILSNVPSHPCAKAYIKGLSIVDNARFHKSQKNVLKMDIKDFFPSVPTKYVNALFKRMGYNSEVSKLLTELVTYKNGLPQGAPTSPSISNLIMYKADTRIFGYTCAKKLRYTRYADDLTISGEFTPGEVISFIEMIIKETGFKINRKKTRVVRNSSQQLVTGIVVNEKLQVSKEIRKKLRQELYYIRTYGLDAHLSHKNITKINYIPHLLGVANYILHVNPDDKDAKEVIDFFDPQIEVPQ